MSAQRVGVIVGIALVLAAVVLSALPFHRTISMDDASGVTAQCRSPILAAWNRDPKGPLALWAVTTESGSGYEIRSGQEPWCAEAARTRLAIAGGVLLAGVAAAAASRRALRRRA